jgi:hypothetical protein
MSITKSLLRLVVKASKSNGKTNCCTSRDIEKILGIEKAPIGTALSGSVKDGHLILVDQDGRKVQPLGRKEKKVGTTNTYRMTKEGKNYLSRVPEDAFYTNMELASHFNSKKKTRKSYMSAHQPSKPRTTKPNRPPARISTEALSALEGITALMDENDRLRMNLTSISTQLGMLKAQTDELINIPEPETNDNEEDAMDEQPGLL